MDEVESGVAQVSAAVLPGLKFVDYGGLRSVCLKFGCKTLSAG